LTTSLFNAQVAGARLTSAEIASSFILLVIAGTETSRNALSRGLVALSRFSDERQLCWDDAIGYDRTAVKPYYGGPLPCNICAVP
jgi:cytochrome P450